MWTPRNWWLRPPNVSNQNNARNVNTDGTLNNNNSNNSNGLAPGLHGLPAYSNPPAGGGNQSDHHARSFCPVPSGRILPADASNPKRVVGAVDGGPFLKKFLASEIRDAVCSFDSLYKAMLKCRLGVMWKDSTARLVNWGPASIFKHKREHDNGTYKISPYPEFVIHEPKRRVITSTRLCDRIFQRSLCDNYLYKEITRHLVYDNCACQTGKGTDFARNRLKVHLQRYYRKHGCEGWYLKVDMKNYFGSTPHKTAKWAVRKAVRDDWSYKCVEDVIDSFGKPDAPGVGIGLGSQIAQLIELIVLSDIDHAIKESFRIKHYIRYMDDLLLVSHDKELLRLCLEEIYSHINELGLTVNGKKTKICKLSHGINFLGFRFKLTESGKVVMTILKKNVKRRRRKMRNQLRLVMGEKMTVPKFMESYKSWRAHASKGSSNQLLRRMDEYAVGLLEETYVQDTRVG